MKPRCILFTLLAAVVLALSPVVSTAQTVIAPSGRHVAREPIEWIRLWLSNVNKQGLPQVLLIGDSITAAYYDDVARDLKGKAYVGYFASSLSVGDPMLPKQIALLLRNYKFDVIHFNNGLHGRDYSEEEYARYFPQYVKAIQANARGARLIWANSTPVRMGKRMSELDPWTKRVAARNKIADADARKRGIPIDDLYAVVLNHPEYYVGVDDAHPNAEGKAAEARAVAASMLKALGK